VEYSSLKGPELWCETYFPPIFDVLVAVNMKNVTSCGLTDGYQRSRGTKCLHLQALLHFRFTLKMEAVFFSENLATVYLTT
jgi:hypothetical protein